MSPKVLTQIPIKERKIRNISCTSNVFTKKQYVYKSLQEISSNISTLKTINLWQKQINTSSIVLSKIIHPYVTPFIGITIDDGLGFTIKVLDWFLPEDHCIYKDNKRSMKNVSVVNLAKSINNFNLCKGISDKSNSSKKILHHVVQKSLVEDSDDGQALIPFNSEIYYRVQSCIILIENSVVICNECRKYENSVLKYEYIKTNKVNEPAKRFAPLTKTNPVRVKLALQNERLKCAQLEKRLHSMRQELTKNNVSINNSLSNDLIDIISKSEVKLTPFMNLFWQEQKKLQFRSPKGMRYHPMVIKYCLPLHQKVNLRMKSYEIVTF